MNVEHRISKKKQKKSLNNYSKVRFIGGKWRGQNILFPPEKGLRPTLNRMRETLFNWLQMDIEGADCLDLFTGSGALGLEALSRGAKKGVFLDNNPHTIKMLKKNIAHLGADNIQIYPIDALSYLQYEKSHFFDVVFLDPPFMQNLLPVTCQYLEQYHWIKSGSYIYLEAETTWDVDIPDNWLVIKQKHIQQVSYYLCQRAG